MGFDVNPEALSILEKTLTDPRLRPFVDASLPIPRVWPDSGEIRLIILGQDPTVKNEASKKNITHVLNLDKKGGLRTYLSHLCSSLGFDIDHEVYATNLFKNFFVKPPTQIKEIDVFEQFPKYWLPLLLREIARFPGVPVISLGEPLLKSIILPDNGWRVREYWGYVPEWKSGHTGEFKYSPPGDNRLNRPIFPFPHQPSVSKRFYKERLDAYIGYVRENI